MPYLVILPFQIALLWPIVTSEYIDDDVRNAHLARGFSTSFYFTVLLMVPVILFGQEIQNLGWSVSSWILLSIPLTLFLIGSVLPFYLGLFQHRHQARLMIEWRRKWLRDLLPLMKLPEGMSRPLLKFDGGSGEILRDVRL